MSSTAMPRFSIAGRSTSTILRQRHTATATAGGVATSALVGPASGKKWWIAAAVVEARFLTNPGGGDSGSTLGEVVGNAPDVTFIGRNAAPSGEEGAQFSNAAPGITLEFGDEIRISVDAVNSAQDIGGTLTFWGFEYDDIS